MFGMMNKYNNSQNKTSYLTIGHIQIKIIHANRGNLTVQQHHTI
jgi:hypothetical protein